MAHILLAEDDESLRKFLAAALVKAGHAVTDFGDGGDAYECIKGFTFDLLLTDIVMPGMDGPALVRALRQIRPGLPAILVSGYAEEALRRELADSRAAFLAKPYTLRDLAELLERVVRDSA